MSNAAVEIKPTPPAATTSQISWLALTLTPGLGPTRAKRLVEFFGSVEAVFNTSLTELEAAGLPVAAAQSLGTGKSVELAHDEIAKATAAGIECVTLDYPSYPPRLRQIYDPPPHQTGRKAGRHMGGRLGGTPCRCTTCAHSRNRR